MNNPTTDEQLAVAVRENNKELYSEIVRRYQTKLSHYLRKFISNPEQLQDVLQEVFLKAYRNLYGFNADERFSPWIYRIAHNEAVNFLKKNSRYTISLEDKEIDLVDEKINLNEHIDRKILKEKISQVLVRLKDKYREPLILYFFEEKSYEEISDILKIPVSTVGVLIMRAKNLLKDYLKNEKYVEQIQ